MTVNISVLYIASVLRGEKKKLGHRECALSNIFKAVMLMEGKFTLYSSKTQKIYLIQKYSQSDAQTMGILESEAFKMELKEQQ